MAKRLNPYRRLLQRQAAALAAVRLEQSAVHGAEMAKLQQGSVRSGLRSNPTTMTFRSPHWTDPDSRGKRIRKPPKRFGSK